MPHVGRTPQHLMRSPVCPGGRAWRLASRLAVPRIAYTLCLLSRSSAAAHLGAGLPGSVAVPGGSTSRRVAHGIPTDRSTSLPPEVMQIALRRRLRLLLPLGPGICGQHVHGCRRRLDPWGDHALACLRSGLLARRAKLVEQAWLAVSYWLAPRCMQIQRFQHFHLSELDTNMWDRHPLPILGVPSRIFED